MENFEKKALSTTSTPRLWMRYADDTFVIQQEGQKQTFLEHINKIDPALNFTVEGNHENCAIQFLDTLVKQEADKPLSIVVYRKPMHTDQYLQWDSHHNLVARYSVISTLIHRAKTVCNGPKLLNKEIKHLRRALTKCKCLKLAIGKVERKFLNNNCQNSNNQGEPTEVDTNDPSGNTTGRDPNKDKHRKGHIIIPYTQGLGESIKKICSRYEIQTHFKGSRTIKETFFKPKDKDLMEKKSGAIYWYQCGELACNEEYKGETSRTFGERYKEHLKEPSPIHAHNTQTGHSTTPENFNIIRRENHSLARTIKESIYIGVNNPTLNRNVGKYNLHHIWDIVLFNTPDLKINNDNGHAHRTSSVGMLSPFQPISICLEP